MTTIVYDHKSKLIAVDGRSTDRGGVIASDKAKKSITNELGMWFLTGLVADHPDLVKLKHNDTCDPIPDCSAILIKNGVAWLVGVGNEKFCSHEKLEDNQSLGSGFKFALSALDFGKTAKEAVEYAITKDCYSGGKVRVFNLYGEEVK